MASHVGPLFGEITPSRAESFILHSYDAIAQYEIGEEEAAAQAATLRQRIEELKTIRTTAQSYLAQIKGRQQRRKARIRAHVAGHLRELRDQIDRKWLSLSKALYENAKLEKEAKDMEDEIFEVCRAVGVETVEELMEIIKDDHRNEKQE